MNETYYYPYNLKSQAKLWLWNLRDIVIIGVALLLSILALAHLKFYIPMALTLVYMFLSVRLEDVCILDYIRCGVKYFLLSQQYYEWKEEKTNEER